MFDDQDLYECLNGFSGTGSGTWVMMMMMMGELTLTWHIVLRL